MCLVWFNFADAASARACLLDLIPQLANGFEVWTFNGLFKHIHARGGDTAMVQAGWANLWLSRSGLETLEAPGLDDLPDDFREGMAGRADQLGDVNRSAPTQWKQPFTDGAGPHAVLVLAADTPDDLETRTQQLTALVQNHSATLVGVAQDGNARPGDQRGHEHFGFKDGISQPGIKDFTTASRNDPAIAAGEFILGYPDEDGTRPAHRIQRPRRQPRRTIRHRSTIPQRPSLTGQSMARSWSTVDSNRTSSASTRRCKLKRRPWH